ncbi:MAG TPA: hypothetical protein ENN03_05345 [bacterium]|nr:hypothetical protein [bacterium]
MKTIHKALIGLFAAVMISGSAIAGEADNLERCNAALKRCLAYPPPSTSVILGETDGWLFCFAGYAFCISYLI